MATYSLSSAPPPGLVSYLDTCAFYPLSIARQARRGVAAASGQTQEIARAARVSTFVQRARAAGGKVVVTMLAVQEMAAMVRNRALIFEARKAGCADVRALKQHATAHAALQSAQALMLTAMVDAVEEMLDIGVVLDRPAVSTPTDAAAKKQRKRHREVLSRYPQLDSMDALHIVVAAEMGVDSFVTFDKAWKSVSGIHVYC